MEETTTNESSQDAQTTTKYFSEDNIKYLLEQLAERIKNNRIGVS